MARLLEWTSPAKHYFDRLPSKIQIQIKNKISKLLDDPFSNSAVLHDWGEGARRIRSGDWRIIFRVTEDAIRILAIGPRGDVYK